MYGCTVYRATGPPDKALIELHYQNIRERAEATLLLLRVAPRRWFPPGIEPGTFRVSGECDNHYTTETIMLSLFP